VAVASGDQDGTLSTTSARSLPAPRPRSRSSTAAEIPSWLACRSRPARTGGRAGRRQAARVRPAKTSRSTRSFTDTASPSVCRAASTAGRRVPVSGCRPSDQPWCGTTGTRSTSRRACSPALDRGTRERQYASRGVGANLLGGSVGNRRAAVTTMGAQGRFADVAAGRWEPLGQLWADDQPGISLYSHRLHACGRCG
jgi:hypothetical protein